MVSNDTTEQAHAVQMAVYRAMGPARRAEVGLRMADEGRQLARDGIQRRHPHYTAAQVEDALRILYVGPDLFKMAWPDRPLLSP